MEHDASEGPGGAPGSRPARRPARGIYLLPNLLTTGCLFAGFYAIVAAIDGNFERSGIAVFVAMLFDGLDGRVARLTSTESLFGKEYDSLADMVAFFEVYGLQFSGDAGFDGHAGRSLHVAHHVEGSLHVARFYLRNTDRRRGRPLLHIAAAGAGSKRQAQCEQQRRGPCGARLQRFMQKRFGIPAVCGAQTG